MIRVAAGALAGAALLGLALQAMANHAANGWAGRGQPLSWWRASQWLLWPLGYCLGALAGGALTGWYPYFFLDPRVLGAGGVALAILALALLFLLLGLGVVAAGRATRRAG